MKFVFTEKRTEIPDTLKSYAEKKVGKLDRYFKSDAEALITFSIERGRHNVEVTVRNANMYFRASESTNDMYASIDLAVTAIERQIHKNKTRRVKKLRQGAFEREIQPASGPLHDIAEEIDFEIVRTKKFPIKPMTPEEAILQMNLLGHHFFVFKNQEDDGRFAVVYIRNNGGYGLIESES